MQARRSVGAQPCQAWCCEQHGVSAWHTHAGMPPNCCWGQAMTCPGPGQWPWGVSAHAGEMRASPVWVHTAMPKHGGDVLSQALHFRCTMGLCQLQAWLCATAGVVGPATATCTAAHHLIFLCAKGGCHTQQPNKQRCVVMHMAHNTMLLEAAPHHGAAARASCARAGKVQYGCFQPAMSKAWCCEQHGTPTCWIIDCHRNAVCQLQAWVC